MADDGTIAWRELWVETTARLDGARDEARWICQRAGSFDTTEWTLALGERATERAVARLDAMVARRLAGEPLQYVLGSWAFRHLELMVDRRVLIPRPETEQVVEVALRLARSRLSVDDSPMVAVDLGTGSGAVALSLVTELPLGRVEMWATDVSADALAVARANLAGLGRAAPHVRMAQGEWFDALPAELAGRVDLVVSNPPYVAIADELEPQVCDWEPSSALLSGADGLDDIRRIVAAAPHWLVPGGWVILEIGATQGEAVASLFVASGLTDVEVHPDLAGRHRIAVARRRRRPSDRGLRRFDGRATPDDHGRL